MDYQQIATEKCMCDLYPKVDGIYKTCSSPNCKFLKNKLKGMSFEDYVNWRKAHGE